MKSIVIFILMIAPALIVPDRAVAYHLEIKSISDPGGDRGDMFFFDVVFHPDAGGNMLGDYGFNISYDSAELTWNAAATVVTPPKPLGVLFQPFELNGGSGMVNGISSLLPLSSSSPANILQDVTLATLAFETGDMYRDGIGDVMLDTSVEGTGFTIDGMRVPASSIPVVYSGTDVHPSSRGAAPEPAGAAMFMIGGVFLALARKKAVLNSVFNEAVCRLSRNL